MKKKFLILAISGLLILSGCNKIENKNTESNNNTEIVSEITTEEIKYYQGSNEFYNLKYGDKEVNAYDLYLPNEINLSEAQNVFLVIHGGSFQRGDKSDMSDFCNRLRNDGFIVINMNYSLMEDENLDVTAFTMLDDITACIKNANNWLNNLEIKTNSIALCGYSAGGHLATLYSYSRPNESDIPIKFVVDMVGPTDFHKTTWGFEEGITSEIGDEEYLNYSIYHLSGKNPKEVSDEEKESIINSISPASFVTENTIPTILAYGDSDNVVGTKQQEPLLAKLDENNVLYDYILFNNCGHTLTDNSEKFEELYQLVLNYSEKYF